METVVVNGEQMCVSVGDFHFSRHG